MISLQLKEAISCLAIMVDGGIAMAPVRDGEGVQGSASEEDTAVVAGVGGLTGPGVRVGEDGALRPGHLAPMDPNPTGRRRHMNLLKKK